MGDDSLFRVVEVESVFVNGPAGKLEARLHAGYSDYLFIICHPHPHFGGSMDDRIVLALSNLLNELGASVIRFNFRGIGGSDGRSPGNRTEVSDAEAVFDWASVEYPEHKIIICGYSYGASISYNLLGKRPIAGMVLIAPPTNFLEPSSQSIKDSLLILASLDQFVPAEKAASFFQDIFESIRILEDDHFFVKTLDELLAILRDFLKERLVGI